MQTHQVPGSTYQTLEFISQNIQRCYIILYNNNCVNHLRKLSRFNNVMLKPQSKLNLNIILWRLLYPYVDIDILIQIYKWKKINSLLNAVNKKKKKVVE